MYNGIKTNHLDEMIEKVRHLAKTYPNGVYVRDGLYCKYGSGKVVNGPEDCGCIMGQAARMLDDSNPIKALVSNADDNPKFNSIPAIKSILVPDEDDYFFKLFEEVSYIRKVRWLNIAQSGQDQGLCWSIAVEMADINYRIDDE